MKPSKPNSNLYLSRAGAFFSAVMKSLLATLALILILEGITRLGGFPPGESSYVQGVLIREKLTPQKPNNEIRIFTYGESTMHGSHYWPFSNIPNWLREYLKDFLPGKKIRIVNFSRMGQGSYYVYETFRDTVAYQPDYAIFYFGHNAFLPGNRVDQVQAKLSKPSVQVKEWTRKSHLISAIYRKVIQFRMKREPHKFPDDSLEFQEIETMPGGIGPENEVVNGSDYDFQNMQFMDSNLKKILRLAKKIKIQALFFMPVGNLKDFDPRGSYHARSLSPQQLTEWERHFEAGKKWEESKDETSALASYEKAYSIDPTFAELTFRMGKLYFKQGHLNQAKTFFIQARDFDPIIVRATTEMQNLFLDYQRRGELDLIDTEKILIPEAPGGILGLPIIEDNVHFSVKGHALVARALAERMAEEGWIAPRSQWKFENERSYDEIYQKLEITDRLLFSAYIKCAVYHGRRYEARLYFIQKALDLYPTDIRALRHLAWTYWLMGEKDKAKAIYQKIAMREPAILEKIFSRAPALASDYGNLLRSET